MKTQKRLILTIVTVLGVLLVFAAPIAAQATVTEFTETESCFPINPGTWTFPDGNIHVRGMVLQCTDTASDPRVSGTNAVVLNANWDANSLGPVWGIWRLVNEGGVWEGTWEGMMTTSGSQIHIAGAGTGRYEGLKLWLNGGNGAYQGRILDPNGD